MGEDKKGKGVIDAQIINLTVKDVNELARILKEEYGIEPAAAAVAVSSGYSTNSDESQRLLGQVYLDIEDDNKSIEIYENFKNLLRVFGIEIVDEGEIIKGSWFRSFGAKINDFLTSKETEERLHKIEQALELKHLDNPQADVDLKKAEAAEKLIRSLKGVSNAAMKVGSLVLIKLTGKNGEENIVVVTLTAEKMKFIDENPDLLGDPKSLLSSLNEIKPSK